MASPARTPPAGNHSDEALDILRRLEQVLGRMDTEQRRQAETLARLEERLRDMPTAKEFGELKGRVSQLPTL